MSSSTKTLVLDVFSSAIQMFVYILFQVFQGFQFNLKKTEKQSLLDFLRRHQSFCQTLKLLLGVYELHRKDKSWHELYATFKVSI